MRACTLVKQILGLKGVVASEVTVSGAEIVVTLKLTATKLACPKCKYKTHFRYDTRTVNSRF